MAGKPDKRVRVRSKPLSEIDETKLALAVWLMAKGIVENRTTTDTDPTDGSGAPGGSPGREAA